MVRWEGLWQCVRCVGVGGDVVEREGVYWGWRGSSGA